MVPFRYGYIRTISSHPDPPGKRRLEISPTPNNDHRNTRSGEHGPIFVNSSTRKPYLDLKELMERQAISSNVRWMRSAAAGLAGQRDRSPVHLHVTDAFQEAPGRPYIGSRDIDLGIHIDPEWSVSALEQTPVATTLKRIESDLGYPRGHQHRVLLTAEPLEDLGALVRFRLMGDTGDDELLGNVVGEVIVRRENDGAVVVVAFDEIVERVENDGTMN